MIIPMLPILNWTCELSLSPLSLSPGQHDSNPLYDTNSSTHPIQFLATQAKEKFQDIFQKQSRTLDDACAEYQRRYGRSPPPQFEKWFKAALDQKLMLPDEFDTMMSTLEPFWGIPPADLRARVESVARISGGRVARFEVKQNQISTSDPSDGMAQRISDWLDREAMETLPDLVFVVNHLDEPRVVFPHGALSQALSVARQPHEKPLLHANNPKLAQEVDMLNLGQQPIWEAVRLSCPADSPAYQFSEATDSPFLTDIGFISNVTLSKDTCQFPELHNIHSSLLFPDSLGITHSLVPVLSQGKTHTFNDLLFPSPSHNFLMDDDYDPRDTDWEEKDDALYWAGANTGGHSTSENWRSFHRQRLVLMTMDNNRPVRLLHRIQGKNGQPSYWVSINSTIETISPLTNARIMAAIQCEPAACKEQDTTFHTDLGRDDTSVSYGARYNLDMDGNGHSGRFYRLLGSNSAVLKQTLIQEWHDDWVIPWLHYFPVSMELEDLPEMIRYLTQEEEGRALGKKVAETSRVWSRKVLRHEDARLYFWRLMLEYGRIMSDDRHQMKCDKCSTLP